MDHSFCLAWEVALGSLIKHCNKSIFNYFAPSLKTCPNQRILKFKFIWIFRLSSMFRQIKLYFFVLTHYVLKHKSFAVEVEVHTGYCAVYVYVENAQCDDWWVLPAYCLDVWEGDSKFVLSSFETLVGLCFPFFPVMVAFPTYTQVLQVTDFWTVYMFWKWRGLTRTLYVVTTDLFYQELLC